ncbi:Hypothetical predicted protein [Podarcis lilfordi]|uniref:Uncharacterized protein n=1 Tax=Podarcis lilfordi TaxID=74358 RepID=A0AA35KW08_9SAUR|nr:Hypothetical predicted protein [Podarcis lilfordi]
MATALLAGEKLKELILPGAQDDKAGSLAALLLQLKLELPFDRVVTIGTVLIPIVLVTLVFTKNFAEELSPDTSLNKRKKRFRGHGCSFKLIHSNDAMPAFHSIKEIKEFTHCVVFLFSLEER